MQIPQYVSEIQRQLLNGVQHDKRKIDKIASDCGITNPTQIKEYTELAVVLACRSIANNERFTEKEKYDQIVSMYHNQSNLSLRTSQSVLFQQYSTPAPISFLASSFVRSYSENKAGYYLEPSAGNGLLTISLPYDELIVNEIDEMRNANLELQPFSMVLKRDGTKEFDLPEPIKGVITNPPFGSLSEPFIIEGYKITSLEHLMAIRALEEMIDTGAAAIIIGGHTEWDDKGRIKSGKNRIFFSYLYKYYNVLDVININGDLYSRQGTSFNVRLILINGRKRTPEGHAPLFSATKDLIVNTFLELYDRVQNSMRNTEKHSNEISLKILRAKAKAIKVKLELESLGGINNKKTASAITVTVLKTNSTAPLVGPPRRYKRRSTTTRPRLHDTQSELDDANINYDFEINKLKELIIDLDTIKIDSNTFIYRIGECFSDELKREKSNSRIFDSKYQSIIFNSEKLTIRVSDHNVNTDNLIINSQKKGNSVAIKNKRTPNTFKANDKVEITEYVYVSENTNNNRFKQIARCILHFIKTGNYVDYAEADFINKSPVTA